jgi:adenosylhomocysteine nucleosidase
MKSVLVCFAVKEEAAAFKRLNSSADVRVLLTGIGAGNAGRTVRAAIEQHKTALLLTCGFAGGLNPELKPGDVLLETSDPGLRDRLIDAGAKPAKFLCATRIATTAVEKQELRRTTGADAVEMESEVIQNICRERGIPCAAVRVISDTASEVLPLDFNKLSRPDLSLDYGKLALAVVKSPGKIPALLRLQRNCKLAAERLAEVLLKIV